LNQVEVEEAEIDNENFVDDHVKDEEEVNRARTEKKEITTQHQHDDDANLFNNKDIPSNIRSNIKNLFDENDSIEQAGINTNTTHQTAKIHVNNNHNAQVHAPHSHSTQNNKHSHENAHHGGHSQHAQFQHQSQLHTQHEIVGQKPKRFQEEFVVSSSSMSISTPKTNISKNISQVPLSTSGTNTNNNIINTPYQNTSFTQQGAQGQVKKPINNVPSNPNSTGTTPNPSVKNAKKNESAGATEYSAGMPSPYMPPWGMSPMGFYMPPQNMGFDPSQMGGQPSYPMMPMYYFPGYGYPQGEVDDNLHKNKKNTNV
jgi:hypothetical protein